MLDYRSMKHTTLSAAILVTFLLFGVMGCSSSQQQTNATPASSDQPAQAPSQAEASSSQSASEAPAPQPTAPQQQAAPSPIGSPPLKPALSAHSRGTSAEGTRTACTWHRVFGATGRTGSGKGYRSSRAGTRY